MGTNLSCFAGCLRSLGSLIFVILNTNQNGMASDASLLLGYSPLHNNNNNTKINMTFDCCVQQQCMDFLQHQTLFAMLTYQLIVFVSCSETIRVIGWSV